REGFDGAQDHDLALRLTESSRRIGHIADVLYSWRQAAGSVAADPRAKMYAYEAGRAAVQSALDRRGEGGSVSLGEQLGTYHARRGLGEAPAVAIIIPTRDRVELLLDCISSVETVSTYRNWSITIIDNGSVEPETRDYLARTVHSVVPRPGAFNYSELMNLGRSSISAPYLLMLNNDVVTTTPGWIEALLEHAQRAEVGAVGARLVYPNGRTQHEGIGLGNICRASTAVNLDAGWMGRVVRDVSAVTGACQMVRTAVFDEVGGYDPTLPLAYNDVDFCLRVRATGRLVVYTPHAELRHREGASRGRLHHLTDEELFWRRWGREGGIRDPYVNPHLRSLNPLQLRLGPVPTDR
ncbi:MAG: glycosyltransferase family 2 protein, partial [Acidimicrobiales bacterium]